MLIIKEKDKENAGKYVISMLYQLFPFEKSSSMEQISQLSIFMLMIFIFCTLAFCVRI